MTKNINDLERDELKRLLENNHDLYYKFWNDFQETIYYFLDDEVFRHFRSVRGVRYDVSYSGVWFTVSECGYKGFLNGCVNLIDSGLCLFSDRVATLIKRADAKSWFYEYCDIDTVSDNTWEHFSKWYKDIIELAIDEISEYCRGSYDSADDLEELTEYAFDECDGLNISVNMESYEAFETIVKKYA